MKALKTKTFWLGMAVAVLAGVVPQLDMASGIVESETVAILLGVLAMVGREIMARVEERT
tara:strand:- start:959 stop:1138 length:180 start_codon:yes stop_codon:yes gene_type:complete